MKIHFERVHGNRGMRHVGFRSGSSKLISKGLLDFLLHAALSQFQISYHQAHLPRNASPSFLYGSHCSQNLQMKLRGSSQATQESLSRKHQLRHLGSH